MKRTMESPSILLQCFNITRENPPPFGEVGFVVKRSLILHLDVF